MERRNIGVRQMRQISSQFSRHFRVFDVLVHSMIDKFKAAKDVRLAYFGWTNGVIKSKL